jgi:hypothetical protein
VAYRVSIEELGIANDHAVFEGQTPGDVWRRVAEHLHDKHNIDIPDVDETSGEGLVPLLPRFDGTSVGSGQQGPMVVGGRIADDDRGVNTIVSRLLEKLNAGTQASESGDIVPPGDAGSLLP